MNKHPALRKHTLSDITEDLALWGSARWLSHCDCGWDSRPCTTPQMAMGLWRQHIVWTGRGQARRRH